MLVGTGWYNATLTLVRCFDAEVELDVIWMPGGLLVTDRLERGFL